MIGKSKKLEERVRMLEKAIARLEEQVINQDRNPEVYIEPIDMSHIPVYANINDAGADLLANEDMILEPGDNKMISLGFKIAIPDGYEMQIRPRSGISVKTNVKASIGTVDAGYRGEVRAVLYKADNLKTSTNNPEYLYSYIDGTSVPKDIVLEESNKLGRPIQFGATFIRKNDRIAQMVLNKISHAQFIVVDDVSVIGQDRKGGFGSTGIKNPRTNEADEDIKLETETIDWNNILE